MFKKKPVHQQFVVFIAILTKCDGAFLIELYRGSQDECLAFKNSLRGPNIYGSASAGNIVIASEQRFEAVVEDSISDEPCDNPLCEACAPKRKAEWN